MLVTLSEAREVLRLDNLLYGPYALDTPPYIMGVFEVVEGDSRVVVDIGVDQLELSFGLGSGYLLQDEPSLECLKG